MELGVRDWMIIVGVLLILAVLLDGYRRVRNERRGNIRLSLNKQFLNAAGQEDELSSSELPNGGARVVGRRHSSAMREEPELGDLHDLDLDQAVPLLMESVVSANIAGELAGGDEEEDAFLAGDLFAGYSQDDADTAASSSDPRSSTDKQSSARSAPADDRVRDDRGSDEQPRSHADAEPEPEPRSESKPERESAPSYSGQQEVIVINVIARAKPFKGPDLLHILLACDMRYGKMNIFHRHEQANGRGQVQFSVANSVEPGTFDLDAIDDFTSPGVCFFMSVPGPEEPIKAFECMVETAQCVVKNLDGEMLDDSRSAMTMQTLEHCRQRLRDFERRQLAQA